MSVRDRLAASGLLQDKDEVPTPDASLSSRLVSNRKPADHKSFMLSQPAKASRGRGRGVKLPPVANGPEPQEIEFSKHQRLPPSRGATKQEREVGYAGDIHVAALKDASTAEILDYAQQQGPALGFVYAIPAKPRSSVHRSIYDLKVVSHNDLDDSEFFTISCDGVTHVNETWSEFYDMNRFVKECQLTTALKSMPLVGMFRQWKAFATWRKVVTSRRHRSYATALSNNAYILSKQLRPALLKIRAMCLDVVGMRLTVLQQYRTYTLEELLECQHEQLNKVTLKLNTFRDDIAAVASQACQEVLQTLGYHGTAALLPYHAATDYMLV
jgi:hypothetical protein